MKYYSITILSPDFACRICFSVEMQTRWGEEVRVVGSRPELGSWDPAQGVPLQTCEGLYPMWSGTVDLGVNPFEYKFIITGPWGVTWEQGPNRKFLLFQPSAIPVSLKVPQSPSEDGPAVMCRRRSILPMESEQQLPTLLSTPVSPPASPKKRGHGIEWSKLQVVKDLGVGNYGVVKLVKDRQGKLFALKRQEMAEEKDKEWWRQEIVALSSCQSPFIVQMKGYLELERSVDIALEFCVGGDLQALYDDCKGVLSCGSKPHSQFYMACAAMALQHLHQKHFIYRDLKPENLLVDGAGWCKLCDMGHAKQVTPESRLQTCCFCLCIFLRFMTLEAGGASLKSVRSFHVFLKEKPYTGTNCGSLPYAAPETLVPHARYDRAVDFWALGVLLFELSFGSTPFFDFSEVKLARNIRRGFREESFPKDQACSDRLKELLGAMLRKVPGERLPMKGIHRLEEASFFEDFDWPALKEQTLVPPFQPQH